jgi:hypothetical protein
MSIKKLGKLENIYGPLEVYVGSGIPLILQAANSFNKKLFKLENNMNCKNLTDFAN